MISDKFHTDEWETDFLWKFSVFPKGILGSYVSFSNLLCGNGQQLRATFVGELHPVFCDSK